jgi:hypothetical protein
MLTTIDQLAKGIMAMMHEVALLRSEVSALRKANEALIKRRRAKKKHAYSLGDHLLYRIQRIYLIRRPQMGRYRKKRSWCHRLCL